MGALHDGHLSLVETARKNGADRIVVSIFVNPTQFGPNEDLDTYPRDLEGDLTRLRRAGVDLLFVPTVETIYPPHSQTFVTVEELQKPLCGRTRPDHFRGVATVVSLLFNIVEPDIAVFGQKDFQQLQVIRQIVRDLHMGVNIVGSPIVREADGLAMSSRNQKLTDAQRAGATSLFRAIGTIQRCVALGEDNPTTLIKKMRCMVEAAGGEVDYVRFVDPVTLADVAVIAKDSHALIAAYFGATRLIDNAPAYSRCES